MTAGALAGRVVLHVCNDFDYWLNHRAPIAVAAHAAGAEVVVATAPSPRVASGLPAGLRHVPLALDRYRARPLEDLRLVRRIPALADEVSADIVHLFTLKPLVLGGLGFAFARARRPRLVATVAGLGRGFGATAHGALSSALILALRTGLGRVADAATFENPADRDFFVARRILPLGRTLVLPGAGVDLDLFHRNAARPPGPLSLLFASRLLRSKGVLVVAEAFRRLQPRFAGRISLTIAGPLDPADRDSLDPAEVAAIAAIPGVTYRGAVEPAAMPALLADADVVVLPTLYPEGLPRILIEGAAARAALITTDTPASRMLIEPGESGLLIATPDAASVASAIETLFFDPDLRDRIATGARKTVESGDFSVQSICRAMLRLYCGEIALGHDESTT